MRATAAQSDRVVKPVYHIALSLDPGDTVDRATMARVAGRVLDRLGLGEHQAVIVAHRDRTHAHVHILVNRVHPETGKAWERWQDQPVIQQVLREEERALGLREVTSSLQPREARPREPGTSRVGRLVQLLKNHERILGLARERNAAQVALAAARTRSAEVTAAAARARAAGAGFRRALGAVYGDPGQACRSFMRLVEAKGIDQAVGTLRERPERLSVGCSPSSVRARWDWSTSRTTGRHGRWHDRRLSKGVTLWRLSGRPGAWRSTRRPAPAKECRTK